MEILDVVRALAGGALVGVGLGLPLRVYGHAEGVSGMAAGLGRGEAHERRHRAAFLLGLVIVGGLAAFAGGMAPAAIRPGPIAIAGGLLVGLGARLANGCTSGHGVLGVGRGATRSLVAVLLFMAFATLTVALYPVGG
jgi:uncharacterized membrane protein YedE/YeeE